MPYNGKKRKGDVKMAKTPKKQLEWSKNYLEKMDEIKIRLPQGEKDKIKAHAEKQGESMNAFVIRAIMEAMERDKGE